MALETQAAFARRLGVSKQAVADYIKRKKLDGTALVKEDGAMRIDVDKALAQLRKRLDPDQRISGNARANLRKPAEPAPIADAAMLWSVLHQVPSMAAWDAAQAGDNLQRCYDAFANSRLNIIGELSLCFGAVLPGDFEAVDWVGLAEEYGMVFVDPDAMEADWERRRLADE